MAMPTAARRLHGTDLQRSREARRVRSHGGQAERQGMQGVSGVRWPMGPPQAVHELRSRGLLRLVSESACDEAFPPDQASDDQVVRARRGLGVLLPRRSDGRWPQLPSRGIDVASLRSSAFVASAMKVTAILVLLGAAATVTPLALPGGEGGIGFDDLRFSSELNRLLVPAGASGRLDLVDPKTQGVSEIAGFSTSPQRERGHSQGTTSADSGDGLIFASDRTAGTLAIVDPAGGRIVSSVKLGGAPDYVRWVAPLREVWVSEPGSKAIEAFRLERKGPPSLARVGTIEVADGPESLEIDLTRRRAYTNTWHDATLAIDLSSRTIVARWPNGCEGARGLALDGA